MASKNKKKQAGRSNAPAKGSLCQEVERLIAKDRLKDAVKQAKLCYKDESTPENHQLLERAYLLRADQLRRNAMPTAAQEVAQHLLDFGVTGPALIEPAARLLLALGMSKGALALQGRLDSPEARDRLARQAADQAVLHPDRDSGTPPEIRQGAGPIREALEALQAGDETTAMEKLRDVARSSPFSDWKLFARGLAAFSRHEVGEARANWERLDPDRAPSRIARALLSLNDSGSDRDGKNAGVKLGALEKQVFGEPVLEPLEQLRTLMAEDRFDDAIRRLALLRLRLERIDPKLARRLTQILYDPLIRAATDLDYRTGSALVKEFTRVAEPLPIDPNWNRLWAMVWEGPQGSVEEAEDYWHKYLKDLETLPSLSPDERRLAQALVWKHLGTQYLEDVRDMRGPSYDPFGPSSPREIKDAKKEAVACLERSLKLAPDHRETYRALLEAYDEWRQPDQAAAVGRRLLEKFPDDFETVIFLSEYHFEREEPALALEYAKRARALKPLDPEAARHEWAVHVLLARELAFKKRWDEGRAAFDDAARAWPDWSQGAHFQARKAVFELKAGQTDRAETLIADAQERLTEPAPLWLALLIEAIRYKLPKADKERFEAQWVKALTRRRRAETAGALAELMGSFVGGGFKYPGQAEHLKQVTDYIRPTSRLKYRREDLAEVCRFLALLPKERALYETMVKRGLKLFPEAPAFLVLAGHLEMEKGPFRGGHLPAARKHFEKALERARASSDPKDAELLPEIQKSLSMLKDLSATPFGLPFGGFGFGGGPFSNPGRSPRFPGFLDAMASMMDYYEDDEFDDDDDDEFDDGPPPLPSPRRSSPGRKRKKG